MNDELHREKAELRRQMKAWLRAREPEEARRESARLCEWLRTQTAVGVVAAFYPLPGEVDLRTLLAELAAGGRLVLPRVANSTLTLHVVHDLDSLRPGPLGLREPDPAALIVPPAGVHTVLVPGLAFTPEGHRLGRGKGLYDRLLAGLPIGTPTIGVGFAGQLVADLPTEPHDVRLGRVVPPLTAPAC